MARSMSCQRYSKVFYWGLGFCGILYFLVSPSSAPVLPGMPRLLTQSRRESASISQPASISQSASDCPAPVVDWSQFPGVQSGSTAGVLAENLLDPALPWVIHGLQRRSYEVRLFVEKDDLLDVFSLLAGHGLNRTVSVEAVKVRHYMVNASLVHMFVYMPKYASSVIAGRGIINWLIIPDGARDVRYTTEDQANPSDLVQARGGPASGAHLLSRQKGKSEVRKRLSSGSAMGQMRGQGKQDSLLRTGSAQPADVALATYDYMLYRSISDLVNHVKFYTPALERLQLMNRLFPLMDVLTFPDLDIEDQGKAYQQKFDQMAHRSSLNKVFRFFVQSTLNLYKRRLTPAKQDARNDRARAGRKNGVATYAAVIVEARPHFAFLYTVLNAVWYLPGWTLNVVHTRLNSEFVRHMLSPYVNARYHQLNVDNIPIDDYNNLMKNQTFWKMLDADHVLLFQTDSLILHPGAETFLQFDYIGAPWHLENEQWSKPAMRKALPDGVGNGGFSLRSTRAMIAICEKYGTSSPIQEHEDVFFGVHIMEDPQFKMADRLSAYRFCLEVPCRDLTFDEIPFGGHALWYYHELPTMIKLLDYSLYGLAECTK